LQVSILACVISESTRVATTFRDRLALPAALQLNCHGNPPSNVTSANPVRSWLILEVSGENNTVNAFE